MFALSLIASAICSFEPSAVQSKDAQFYLKNAISNRQSIKKYDLSAEIVRVEKVLHTGQSETKNIHYRIAFNGTATRVDCTVTNKSSGQIEKNYSICDGLTPDRTIYYRDLLTKEISAVSKDDPRARLLLNPLLAGFAFVPFEQLDRNTVSFDKFLEEQNQRGAFTLLEETKFIKIRQKPKDRQETLTIQFDPQYNGNLTKIAYDCYDEPKSSFESFCRFAIAINGVYFPYEVEMRLGSKDRELHETITFHTLHFNEPIAADVMAPASLDLNVNTPVMVLEEGKPTVQYFDGEKLSPAPVPSIPAANPKENQGSIWKPMIMLALIFITTVIIIRMNAKRGPQRRDNRFDGSMTGEK